MALSLQHQTVAEFAERFWKQTRAAYDADDKPVYHHHVWWLRERIAAGDVTSTQARTAYNAAFGTSVDATTWANVYVPRFQVIADRYEDWRDEVWIA